MLVQQKRYNYSNIDAGAGVRFLFLQAKSLVSGQLNVQRRTVRFSCYLRRIKALFGAVIC